MTKLEKWLAERPESVRKLAEEFPINTTVLLDGDLAYIMGYTEGDELIFSFIDPRKNYEKAVAERFLLCAKHVREAKNQQTRRTH